MIIIKKKEFQVLALNPFHGGSHKSFVESWIEKSQHSWTLLTLPGSQWKWRLQFAAVEFLAEIRKLYEDGQRWDLIFCSSMMNIAEFRGLAPFLSDIPLVAYFHENQLTYPESRHHKFDLNLCMININSALAADAVWFNSDFHRKDFLKAARHLLNQKPGKPVAVVDQIASKSTVQHQAIADDFFCAREVGLQSPLKLVWAARWEEDKNPSLLFAALRELKEKNFLFKISILGEQLTRWPECFQEAEDEFASEIDHFGYAESREQYKAILQEGDIFISTADHEFFGIAAVEALAAGCLPIVPDSLAYPDVLAGFEDFFYKPGCVKSLVQQIETASRANGLCCSEKMQKYFWSKRVLELDDALVLI